MSSKTVNKPIFDFFNDLGANSHVKRSESCIALVQHLASQNSSTDFSYSLKRLIRGLGATKESLAKGSFTALVSVLDTFPSLVKCETFLELIDKEFGGTKDDSKKEVGEAHMGQVLAFGAAIRGGLFSKSEIEQQKRMLTTLIHSGEKKSYLPFIVSSFLQDLINMSEKPVLAKVVWPVLEEEIPKSAKGLTLDTLLLLLSLSNKAPDVIKERTIQNWLGFQLMSSEAMELFANKLVRESTVANLNHPVNEELCRTLSVPSNKSLLKSFWTVHVNALLKEHNRNRDRASLHLFTLFLKHLVNKQQIEVLVTTSFLSVFGRILSMPPSDRKLSDAHQVAQDALNSLKSLLTSDDIPDKVTFNVLCKIFDSPDLQLVGAHFSVLLDGSLSSKYVEQLAKRCRDVIDGANLSDGQALINANRKIAVQQLTRLMGHPACNDNLDWKVQQLVFLLDRAVFIQKSSNTIGAGLAQTLKDSFFSALDQKFPNLEAMLKCLSQTVAHVNGKLSNQKDLSKIMRSQFSSEALDSWHTMYKQVLRIEEKNSTKKSAEQIFHLLFLSMGLQLLSDPKLAIGALEELHSCFKRMKSSKRASKSQDEPEWIEVTIDLFLSLLSHDSHLLRTIVGKAFPYLSKHLTVSAFYQILEVLDPNQNDNPLTSAKDIEEASGSETESSDSEDDAPNPQHANGKQMHTSEGDSDAEDGSDDEDSDDNFEDIDGEEEEEEKETINDKLRQELRLALGNAASLTDTESVDLDDIDEEEGKRVDAALAAAFKSMKMTRGKSKNKKEKKEEPVLHFRSRVLDLVEIYISKEPAMDICHECITPLLSLLNSCMKDARLKTVENKTRNILNKLTSVKKFSSMEGVDEESIANQIEALAVKGFGNASTFLHLSTLIYKCCTYLAHCSDLVRANSSKPAKQSPVVNVYNTLLLDFFTKRKTLLSIEVFKSVLNLRWSGWWYIAPSIVQYAFNPKVLLFRRGQALDLLIHFFRNNQLLSTANKVGAVKEIVASILDHTAQFLNSTEQDPRLLQHVPSVLRLVHRILINPTTKPTGKSALSSALTSFCQRGDGIKKETKRLLRLVLKELKLDLSLIKDVDNSKKTASKVSSRREDDDTDDEEEDSEDDEHDDTSQQANGSVEVEKKRSKHGRKGKGKKEKKLQRLASMEEGLQSFAFSDVNSDVINGFEPDDEEMEADLPIEKSPKKSKTVNTNKSLSKRKSKQSVLDDSQISKKKKKVNG